MSVTRYVRSFNRFELKYLLPAAAVSGFVEALGNRVVADPNSVGERGYPVYSVYCDSDDFALFWEKVEGYDFRRKLRFRRYAGGEQAYIEIKQRIGRTLQKRRVRWPVADVLQTFYGGESGEIALPRNDDAVANEALFLWRHYRLAPRLAIRYNRRALFAVHESDLRITFDSRVQYHPGDIDVSRPFETGKYVIDPELSILEIKYSDQVPLWLCKLISEFQFETVRMSKYCTAVDLEYYRGEFT